MNANLYVPGDEQMDLTLAEFLGYFWCRYQDGLIAGERIVRFLVSPQQFEEARKTYGPTGIVPATMQEPVEQLAFKAVPAFHASRDEMAQVEDKLKEFGYDSFYRAKLREIVGGQPSGPLHEDEAWRMITASARLRVQAAYLVIVAQHQIKFIPASE